MLLEACPVAIPLAMDLELQDPMVQVPLALRTVEVKNQTSRCPLAINTSTSKSIMWSLWTTTLSPWMFEISIIGSTTSTSIRFRRTQQHPRPKRTWLWTSPLICHLKRLPNHTSSRWLKRRGTAAKIHCKSWHSKLISRTSNTLSIWFSSSKISRISRMGSVQWECKQKISKQPGAWLTDPQWRASRSGHLTLSLGHPRGRTR